MPWLHLHGESRQLDAGETVVGSGDRSDWRLTKLELQPRHFVLDVAEGRTRIHPFVSDAVVAVNGKQISGEPCALSDGDVIAAGTARFVFSAGDHPPMLEEERAVPGAAAYLVEVAGARAHPLTDETVGIGRDPGNAVLIHDATASRFHAEVRCEAGGWVLHPMGSSGTRLNGQRVSTPCLLEEGDEIEVAYTVVRFTRGPLPAGVTIGRSTVPAGTSLEAAHRPTIQLPDAVAQEAGLTPRRRHEAERQLMVWAIVAVVALAVVAYLFVRRG